MKSGPEIVKAGLRQFFESAADDIEKMVENLKLGKVSSRNQVSNRNWLVIVLADLYYLPSVSVDSCRLKVCPKISTTPPLPCCQCSHPFLTTLHSTSLEMMLSVSKAPLPLTQ